MGDRGWGGLFSSLVVKLQQFACAGAGKMEAVIEKECSALGGLFQTIISDMKVRGGVGGSGAQATC